MTPRLFGDFETRSACNIKLSGSWAYSLHPTTEILCFAFRLPTWAEGRTALWTPNDDCEELGDLFAWLGNGGLFEGHNVFFERGIWRNILEPQGWPVIQDVQWRCSAAKAAAHSLPRGLGDAVNALRLRVPKDDEGHTLMKKMTKPRNPRKAELTAWAVQHACCPLCNGKGKIKVGRAKATPCDACNARGWRGEVPPFPYPIYHEEPEQLERLYAYCRQDVLAEEALSFALPDLNTNETDIFIMDGRVNERGFPLDREAVETALRLIDVEFHDLNEELKALTGGAVERATQRDRMIAWLETEGVYLENTQAATIDAVLNNVLGYGPPMHDDEVPF